MEKQLRFEEFMSDLETELFEEFLIEKKLTEEFQDFCLNKWKLSESSEDEDFSDKEDIVDGMIRDNY